MTASLALVGACGGGSAEPSAERFCGEVEANRAQLTSPQIANDGDIDALLELYREIGELAPLAVEAEWGQLVSAYETASTVVIGDDESEQAALTAIYRSEQSAAAVHRWLLDACGVDIGPLVTVAPPGAVDVSVPSTTSAP